MHQGKAGLTFNTPRRRFTTHVTETGVNGSGFGCSMTSEHYSERLRLYLPLVPSILGLSNRVRNLRWER